MLAIKVEHRWQADGPVALDVQASLPDRGVTAIFGPSGSGKTTLLRIVAGLQSCPTAAISIGEEIWQDTAHCLPTHLRSLGYVFQEPSLFPHLSVSKNLDYAQRRSSNAMPSSKRAQLLEILGIEHLEHKLPHALSGGERQRVAIARSLVRQPSLLLLDEPLASLDRNRKNQVLPYLQRLIAEWQINALYVSHDLQEIMHIADHMLVLDQGRVQNIGPVAQVVAQLPQHVAEPSVILTCTPQEAEAEWGLLRTHLAAHAAQNFWVPGLDISPLPTQIRVQVRAADVSLTTSVTDDSSILNRLAARIVKLNQQDNSHLLLVELELDGQVLLASVTRKSAEHLGLHPDMRVWAQIKSAAVLA